MNRIPPKTYESMKKFFLKHSVPKLLERKENEKKCQKDEQANA